MTALIRRYRWMQVLLGLSILAPLSLVFAVEGNILGSPSEANQTGRFGSDIYSPGYQVGDRLIVQGGLLLQGGMPTQIIVDTVAFGRIASFHIDPLQSGDYSVPPVSPAATKNISTPQAVGATFDVSFVISKAVVVQPSGYSPGDVL